MGWERCITSVEYIGYTKPVASEIINANGAAWYKIAS